MEPVSPPAPASPQNESAYVRYDRRRREQLLRVLAPLLASTLTVGSLAFTVLLLTAVLPAGDVRLVYGAVLLFAATSWCATLALWRGRTRLATALLVVMGAVGFPLLVVLRTISQGIGPIALVQFMVFGVVVVFVGALADRRTLIGATLALNVITLLVLTLAPPQPSMAPSWDNTKPVILASALVFEWFFAGISLALLANYQRTLHDIGAAYEQAQQLEQMKDRFITHVNHELRTPIMTLDGYVELLQVARPQMSEQEQTNAIAQASRTGKLLVNVLEGILDVRRIDESAVLDPQPVNVAEVLMVAQELLDPREVGLTVRDLHLDVPRDLMIWGEPVRLQQILTNLLSNAIKYSPDGSPLMVQARRLGPSRTSVFRGRSQRETERAMIEIRVRDFGLGVPAEQIPLLFHRFVRLPRDLGSQVSGNGLGLYLCRVFAEAMGGSIHLESAGIPGEGSTFILRLPAADPAPAVS